MSDEMKNFNFIQRNSLDGGFLQSQEWRKFQENAGKNTFYIEENNFSASILEHTLPIVGKYFYLPRGPVIRIMNHEVRIKDEMREMIELAKKNKIGWIRIEPANNNVLEFIKENVSEKIVRAPHDMQPKEIFVINIEKNPENLLAEMKPKTRYNIGVAKKKRVIVTSHSSLATGEEKDKYVEEFLRLTNEMAVRNGIATHPENYYRKMLESFPAEILKIYVAEYEGKIIASNLVLYYGKYATYLHGASGNEHRNVMAPFLLQWQAILDAKEKGCEFYDFGGVQTPGTSHQMHSDLVGITNFKLGFSPHMKPIEFPGSFDIVVNSRAYALYRGLQRAKAIVERFRN